MKRFLSIVFLASALLAGCSDIDTPTTYNRPDYPDPDSTKTDTTKTDTTTVPAPFPDNAIPKGKVDAPYLLVSYYDWQQSRFLLEKYRLDGKARELFIDSTFSVKPPGALPDFSANGSKMVYVSQDSFFLVETATLRKTLITKFDKIEFALLNLSPQGSKVVFVTWEDEWVLPDYYVIDLVTDAVPVKINMPRGDAYLGAISPDETKIAFDLDGIVYVSDLNGNNRIRISDVHGGYTRSDYFPIFNKEGDKVIYYSGSYQNTDLMIAPIKENATSEAIRIVSLSAAHLSSTYQYVLSGDGKDLYLALMTSVGSTDIYRVPVGGGPIERMMAGIGSKEWQFAGIHFVDQ